ncbi:excisionase family DNA-binding protein [Novipirellula caenicola]|uniref:Helix-turn-helix domain protein n=1 Tax=Novipirellula caenicola TaxID=1536901 RepID=A0ABP9VZN4_9BACT
MSEATLSPADLSALADLVANRLADKLRSAPLLITKDELAKRTTLSLSSIERRVNDGTLPAVRVGRRVLFSPDAVVQALSTNERAPKV